MKSDGDSNLLAPPKSGNPAANMLLVKLFAASALAANVGYAATRKVNTPEKIKITLSNISKTYINTQRHNEPGTKGYSAYDRYNPVYRGICRPAKPK